MAKGYSQDYGVDYDETFSPVFKLTSLRILLVIGATLNLKIHQMDVKTAFLNGDIDTELYVRQPQGYEQYNGKNELVCKLRKGLYSLKQAARLWNRKIDKYLHDNGFNQCTTDPCIYTRRTTSGTTYLGIWVDDIIILGTKNEVEGVKHALRQRFKMTDLREVSYLLRITITCNQNACMIYLSQLRYIQIILE